MKKFYDKYSWLIIILLGVLLAFAWCSRSKKVETPVNLVPELKKQDSFRTIIRYHDSTRLTVLKKYRDVTRITDSTPCYTEIKFIKDACDTVILVDSLEILSLKNQHSNDSIIQKKQGEIITQKSDSISTLSKELKWSKLKTKGIIALWVIREAVGVGQKIKN